MGFRSGSSKQALIFLGMEPIPHQLHCQLMICGLLTGIFLSWRNTCTSFGFHGATRFPLLPQLPAEYNEELSPKTSLYITHIRQWLLYINTLNCLSWHHTSVSGSVSALSEDSSCQMCHLSLCQSCHSGLVGTSVPAGEDEFWLPVFPSCWGCC